MDLDTQCAIAVDKIINDHMNMIPSVNSPENDYELLRILLSSAYMDGAIQSADDCRKQLERIKEEIKGE